MSKLMKRIALTGFFASFLVLAPSFAKAATYSPYGPCNTCRPCNCYNPCECGGNFELGADFLYWKPCLSHTQYIAKWTVQTEPCIEHKVSYKGVCPDWEPGLRVYFNMPDIYCDWGISGSWNWIESNASSSIQCDEGLERILIPEGYQPLNLFSQVTEAKAHWDCTYHEWEVLFSTDVSCKKRHHFIPFFGVAGIFFDQDYTVHYKGTFLQHCPPLKDNWRYDYSSDLWGVGLRAGTEYQYRFSECFSFFTKTSVSLLYADANAHLNLREDYQVAVVPLTSIKPRLLQIQDRHQTLKFKDDHCCSCVPGYHIGAGVSYNSCYCGWDISFRLGYEFLQWLNLPNARWLESTPHNSHQRTRKFGFHGLFAGLGFGF